MVNVRFHPDAGSPGNARFNVLLAEDRPYDNAHWSKLLPRLMKPLGVNSYIVHSGEEAFDLAERTTIHAAVVDLATPRSTVEAEDPATNTASGMPGGLWILELFQRLQNSPPVVLVRSKAIVERDINRLLRDALRLGAFTVLENPVQMENLLAVFQRLLDRQYDGHWPNMMGQPPSPETEHDN